MHACRKLTSDSRIYYDEKLIQSFERSLLEAYSPSFVRLNRRPSKASGRFNVEIASGTREFPPADAEGSQKLIEIGGDVPPETFWLAFKSNFEFWKQGEHLLEHISVSVFQQIDGGDLIRMFRAEWDSRAAADPRSGHAQPHWHFAMEADDFRAVLGAEEPRISGTQDTLEFAAQEKTELRHVDFSNFHFAMSPLWQRNSAPPCHRQIFQSGEELSLWFHNLSKYIAEQLAYVSKKMGVRPGVVSNFG
jgi:hypothetical protein